MTARGWVGSPGVRARSAAAGRRCGSRSWRCSTWRRCGSASGGRRPGGPTSSEAIGPVMAWVIPTMLAYIPGVVIGFLMFTLLTVRYRVPSLSAPSGPWPEGEWPAVTVIVAAWNEEARHRADPERDRRDRPTAGTSRWCSRTTTPPTAPPRSPRRRPAARARVPARVRARARQAPSAQHGARDGDDPAGRDRRRRHAPPGGGARLPDRACGDPPAGPAHERLRGRARRPERRHEPALPHAGLGLPARDQRGEADAGGVQQRAGRPGRLLRLLDRGPPRRRRLARRDRRGHRPDLDADE